MAISKARSLKSNQQPRIRLYIADDFRQEVDNKVTAVGLYSDLVVVANVMPGTPPPTVEDPIVINGISAMITVGGLEGEHSVKLDFRDPLAAGPAQVTGPQNVIFPTELGAVNLLVRFQPFITGGPGKKLMVVTVDGEETALEFELRLGKIVPTAASSVHKNPATIEPVTATKHSARKR